MNKNLVSTTPKSSVCSSAMAAPSDKFLVTAVHNRSMDDADTSQALANMELPLSDRVYVAGSLLPRGFDENKKILWDVQVITPVDEAGEQVKQIHISVKEPAHYRGDLNSQSQNMSVFQQTFSQVDHKTLTTETFDNQKELERLMKHMPMTRGESEDMQFAGGDHDSSMRALKSRLSSAMHGKIPKHQF